MKNYKELYIKTLLYNPLTNTVAKNTVNVFKNFF